MTVDELNTAHEVLKTMVRDRTTEHDHLAEVEWHTLLAAQAIVGKAYLDAKYPTEADLDDEPVARLGHKALRERTGRRVTDRHVGRDPQDADVIRLPRRVGSDDDQGGEAA